VIIMTTNVTSGTFGGDGGREHIPVQPMWLLIIRGFQALFSVVTLALSAYALSVFGSYISSGYGLNIFTSIYTLIFLGYILGTGFFAPHAYNCWAHLGLEIAANIFWLSTFAVLAQTATYYDAFWRFTGTYSSAKGATQGGAALGAITWALFIASLVTFGIMLHRMRMANGAQGPAVTPVAMEEGHKMQPVVNQQPVNGQQQQYYQQQPPAPQQYAPNGQTHQSPYPEDPVSVEQPQHYQQQQPHA